MTVHRTPITSRADWLALRAGKIGGSEIAALFGEHPFKTHLELYAEKAGLVPADAPSSAIMQRGLILEPAVAEAVRTLRPTWRLAKNEDYLWSDDWRLGATPDYLAYDPARDSVGVLQTKAIAMPEFLEKWWQHGPPMGYVLQTTQEVMLDAQARGIANAWGAIGVLAISSYGYETRVWEFERNAGAETRIIRAAEAFWGAVERGEPPAPDFARDGDVIKALHPRDDGTTLDLTGDNRLAFLLDERERLGAEIRTAAPAEKQLDAINAEIKAKIGAASVVICDGWELSHKLQSRKATPASEFRVLRAKRVKVREMAA